MEDKLIVKIDQTTLYYNLRYTLLQTVTVVILLSIIGDNALAKLFTLIIWSVISLIPIIIVIMGYWVKNYGQTIDMTRDYIVFISSVSTVKYLYSDIKKMIIYRQDEETIERMKYDSLLDFYFIKLQLNDDKEILITSLMIKNYDKFIEYFNTVEKTYVQNGVMHIWRD